MLFRRHPNIPRLASALLLTGLAMHALGAPRPVPEVIFGDDDRREAKDPAVPEILRAMATGVAVLVSSHDLRRVRDDDGVHYELPTRTLGERFQLCEDEPFEDQPSPGFCSGFLVGADLLVTAGHCIRSALECSHTSIVFGFTLDERGEPAGPSPAQDVYSCSRLVRHEIDSDRGTDYAVIRLDRPVTGREPLPLRRAGHPEVDDGLALIGHPSGLPSKVTVHGRLIDRERGYLVTDLDSFGGNSGSPVIGITSGLVEGVMVRGDDDFQRSDEGCFRAKRCEPSECRPAEATSIREIEQAIPPIGPSLSLAGIRSLEVEGDGDGIPEPGERLDVTLKLINDGTETLQEAWITLTSETPGVEARRQSSQIRDVPAGATVLVPGHTVSLSPDLPCHEPIWYRVTSALAGGGLRDQSSRVFMGREHLLRYPVPLEPTPIPDGDPIGVTLSTETIPAPAGRPVAIEVAVDHPRTDDLLLAVVSPMGARVRLHLFGATRDGSLPPASRDIKAIYGYDRTPYDDLAPLSQTLEAGSWSFEVADERLGAQGRISALAIRFEDRVCD